MAKNHPHNKQLMAQLYKTFPETVDELPYTPRFSSFYQRYCTESGTSPSEHQFWRMLTGMRKHKELIRKKR